MKWLTTTYIKAHSRIDYSDEDSLLTLYGEAAEQVVLNVLGRSYNDILTQYGAVPEALYQAALMLVDLSYQQRTAVSAQNLSVVPYTFDLLVKPYMSLSYDSTGEKMTSLVTYGSDVKIEFTAELPDDLTMSDVDFTVVVYNDDKQDATLEFEKTDCLAIDEDNYMVLVDSTELGIGTYMLKVTFEIPDTDFTSGIRRDVVKINPFVRVVQ